MSTLGTHSDTLVLALQPATATAIAPYGTLIAAGGSTPRTSSFYGDAVQLWTPGQFISDADTTLSVARVHPRPCEVIWMERHFRHTQCFLPLSGRPFAVVLGLANERPAPDAHTVKAFRFDGNAGLMMHIGTWHEFPFALEGDTEVLIILRNETNRDLEVREGEEAIGGDLEKRNLRIRLGHTFSFDPTGVP